MNPAFRSFGAIATASAAAALLAACLAPDTRSEAAVPRFIVDTAWPAPLPNGWILGQVSGIATDADDHVWVLQRPGSLSEDERGATLDPPQSKCCAAAPPVLEFDAAGKLLRSWGGRGAGYDWPQNEHGIHVDSGGFVWITGNGADDGQILKFTRDGKFVLQIGKPPVDGATKPTGRRTAPPTAEQLLQFDSPVHCVRIARDGLVYVCDRLNNRIQVFRKDGTFVKEFTVEPRTAGNGSVWDIVLSRDLAQRWLFLADGRNNQVLTLARDSGAVQGTLGRPGRYAGEFHWVHDLAIDSQGNLYAGEVDTGKRAQKFVRAP